MAEYIDRNFVYSKIRIYADACYLTGNNKEAKIAERIEELLKEIPTADVRPVEHGKWIPVTERLPEHLTSVIVHRKDGGIFVWEFFNTSPTDECWIDDSMNVYSFYDVTHWMPLPEPPKEET